MAKIIPFISKDTVKVTDYRETDPDLNPDEPKRIATELRKMFTETQLTAIIKELQNG